MIEQLSMIYAERLFPVIHDWGAGSLAEYRAELIPAAFGRILEVGVGSGLNLVHYDPARVREVVGIDPSQGMLRRAVRRRAGITVPVLLVRAEAEQLPFPAESFDSAVATLVFCTIPDPRAALAELARLLKPGGAFFFLEHVASDHPAIRRWQRRLNPLWRRLAVGCHLDRETGATISEAGFTFDRLEVGPSRRWAPPVVRTLAVGIARKKPE